MTRMEFNKFIKRSIILGEIGYVFLFGIPFYLVYINKIGGDNNKFILMVLVLFYIISAVRYYIKTSGEKYEDYNKNN